LQLHEVLLEPIIQGPFERDAKLLLETREVVGWLTVTRRPCPDYRFEGLEGVEEPVLLKNVACGDVDNDLG
jgi:hypothetical protein